MADLLDLYDLAEIHNIGVYWFDLGAAESLSLQMEDGSCAIAMVCLSPWTGGAAVLAAAGSFFYYIAMSRRQFGGVTGDLAGYFLQVCECAMVLLAALAQRAEVLL